MQEKVSPATDAFLKVEEKDKKRKDFILNWIVYRIKVEEKEVSKGKEENKDNLKRGSYK